MKVKKYGVKLVFRYDLPDRQFYEETVLCVRAASADEAAERARNYAAGFVEREYQNLEGENVKVRLCDIADCTAVQQENAEIETVFSRFVTNRGGLPEEAFLEQFADTCTREELKPLRHL